MCTAISFNAQNHYFGRNLDFEHSFGEQVVITPRNFPFRFCNGEEIKSHPAIIGMALACDGYPLYFDATNEKGLSAAGLNFPSDAVYCKEHTPNGIASFELIPYILCNCESTAYAKTLLSDICITDTAFRDDMPPAPLHWIISDKDSSITVEQTDAGLKIYDNPTGVLTNSPPFDMQMFNLSQYLNLSCAQTENRFSNKLHIRPCSRGSGAFGLPGDFSSPSRFVRASFVKLNSICEPDEANEVNQFFRILYSVFQSRGCAAADDGWITTRYSSCCNTDKGIYYYTTYGNPTITAVDMHSEDLDGKKITAYDLVEFSGFAFQNRKKH